MLRGALRYPSYSGGWQLGVIGFSEYLAKHYDYEVVIIIAPVGKAGEEQREQIVCGICGFALDEVGYCPRCKLVIREMAEELEEGSGTHSLQDDSESQR